MSDVYFFSKATCDDETGWNFDVVEQSGAPFCIDDTDFPEFVDGDVPLLLDGQQVCLKPQYVPGTAILDVSSFDSAAVLGPSFDPDSGCCVEGVQNVPCKTLDNEMCPEEPEQPLSNVLRVSDTGSGTGDGSSWLNASTLENALAVSGDNIELWLKAGTYTTNATPYRYNVPESFRLYGGFVGTETSRSQRPTQTAATLNTVISGNQTAGVISVVSNGGGLSVLDSLIIREGFTTNGGGISMTLPSQLIVRNCLMTSNEATFGGVIFADNNATVTLCDCTCSENTSLNFTGSGGVLNAFVVTAIQCFNCLFVENLSKANSGCFALVSVPDVLFINCVFYNNLSHGTVGAIDLQGVPNASILQCTFVEQVATGSNSAGALSCQNSTVDVRNSIFWANTGTRSSDVTIFASTSMSVCNYMSSDTEANSFSSSTTSTISFANRVGGAGVTDPLFVNQSAGDVRLSALSVARDAGDNNGLLFRKCNDTVPVGVPINVDLDLFERKFTDTVDLGAYEFKTVKWQFFDGTKTLLENAMCPEEGEPAAENIIFVKVVATGSADGSSWANAATLETALASAQSEQELWMQSGTYVFNTVPFEAFDVPPGVRLYGGFAGSETSRSQRNTNPATNSTVVDGQNIAGVFQISGSTEASDLCIFDSLTIRNGSASAIQNSNGGNLTVRNCIFRGNSVSSGSGGAINHATGTSNTFVSCNCLFEDNIANNATGGAVAAAAGKVLIANTIFKHNSSDGAGALSVTGCDDFLCVNSTVLQSVSNSSSGALTLLNVDGTILQCSFVDNVSFFSQSAVVAASSSNINIQNTIFCGNTNLIFGPPTAVDVTSTSSSVVNVDTYMASSTDDLSFSQSDGGTINLTNRKGANIVGGIDPLFVDQENGDLRLTKESPARDCGVNDWLATAPVDVNVDLQRIQRIVNTIVDIGAYEWAPDVDCFEVLLSWNGMGPQPCVHGDTLLTVKNRGPVQIRDIKAGDFVLAKRSNDEDVQYVQVTFNVAIHVPKTRFVKFPAGSIGENCPNETLLVRNGHPILTADGSEKFSQDFIDDNTIVWLQDDKVRKVYTLATEDWTFAEMNGAFVKTWDAAGFDHYVSNHDAGKRLFYTKQ